ncbi:MAG: ATP-grasp domain-containing protein, partial [Thermoanaerobaculia bacterium]
LGDQPAAALPEPVRRVLRRHLQVPSLWDEQGVAGELRRLAQELPIDRVECLWEPGMLLAAGLREALRLPGLTVAETVPFRDKEEMKRALDRAGIRTPRHARAGSERACREAAERIGYPLIVKPIAGAGSADTHRLDAPADLERVLPGLRHVPEVSVEEFIDGEEFTFDAVSIEGRLAYAGVCWYRPKPLWGRTIEWISPQTVALRDLEARELQPGRAMGEAVLAALGFRTGFTHMEWFLTPRGEAVFGEIAARPPGARSVEIMNAAGDIDLYRGWAEAVVKGRFSQPTRRLHNAIVVFKRARGQGRIQRIEGLESLFCRYAPHIVEVDLLPVGAARRDWKATLLSDGHLIVRHPDLSRALEIADRVGTDLRLYAA